MRFTATQHHAVDRVAFSWRARSPLAGPFAIEIADGYADGDGRLEVRMFGFPVQRQSGPETVTGEALRYLAELPWVPFAMASNAELEWRELAGRSVEVATRALGDRLVRLDFDDAHDIARASSEMRSLRLDKMWVTRPWAGEYRQYEVLGGVRLPTQAEVYWELEDGRFVYWRGRVTSVYLLDEPFQPL